MAAPRRRSASADGPNVPSPIETTSSSPSSPTVIVPVSVKVV
jgi:hypothetical protein